MLIRNNDILSGKHNDQVKYLCRETVIDLWKDLPEFRTDQAQTDFCSYTNPNISYRGPKVLHYLNINRIT